MKAMLVLMVLCFALLEVNAKVVNREMIREDIGTSELRGVLKALRDLQMLTTMEKQKSTEDSGSHSGTDSGSEETTEEKPPQGSPGSKSEGDSSSEEDSSSGDSGECEELIAELLGLESGELDEALEEFEDFEGDLHLFYDELCEEVEEECKDSENEELNEDEQEMYDDFCAGFCDVFDVDVVKETVCRYESIFVKRVQEQKTKRAEKFAKIFERHIKYLKKTSA